MVSAARVSTTASEQHAHGIPTPSAATVQCQPSSVFRAHCSAFFSGRVPSDYPISPPHLSGWVACSSGAGITVHPTENTSPPWRCSSGRHRHGWAKHWLRWAQANAMNASLLIYIAGGDCALREKWPLFSNSAPPNAVATMYQPEAFRDVDLDDIPWGNRSNIPIWRGNLRLSRSFNISHGHYDVWGMCAAKPCITTGASRIVAIMHSLSKPNQLDARATGAGWRNRHLTKEPWLSAEQNGLSALWPHKANIMSQERYYAHSKVALVLCGIGAAFRLDLHFKVGTAVILEHARCELWYVKYLKPYVHYIPLADNAGNLSDVLEWARAHPSRVAEIGHEGRVFYNEHLGPKIRDANLCYLIQSLSLFLSRNQTHLALLNNQARQLAWGSG